MAAGVGINNIYPPIVTSFAAIFIIGKDGECRIYFSISAYNSIDDDDYKDIHIIVTRQSDNITALSKTDYPSQIKIAPISSILIDKERTSNDKYYIIIKDSDIEGGFQTGIVYKVQMRFSSHMSNRYDTPQKIDDYLSKYYSSFSEWSQVCLVQGIHKPELQIKSSAGGILNPAENNFFNTDTLEVVGTLITDDNDPLRQYEVSLYNKKGTLIETSGVIFPTYQSSENQINYIFKRAMQDGELYTLTVKYMTYGLYEDSMSFPIFVFLNSVEQLDAYIDAIEDEENGRIGVHIVTRYDVPFSGIITIRRTSSKSNFELWEDVHTIGLRAEKLDYLWYDYTIESGVWYRYCIQKRDGSGNRGLITKTEEPVMIVFDNLFLGADGTQIKIKFDPQISSFKTVVSETKIDTIGGQYPYIRRNGVTKYRTFPISGLITFLMDGDKIFTDRTDFYNEETLSLYKKYNDENRINIFNDITYERDFREKVMEFLYKHNVKLFRSATEGNILVKLMDINFTPNQVLGRRIYSFQCTAYEVAEATLDNIEYYNIQQREAEGNINIVLSSQYTYNGQWDSVVPAYKEFVHSSPKDGMYSILEEYYNKDEKQNYILSVDYLDYLRLEIYDEPYAIYDNGMGTPQPYNDLLILPANSTEPSIYMGYIAYINGKTIIIPADGVYELKGKDIQITSLYFAKPTNAEIRYNVVVDQTEDVSKILTITNFTTRVGQEWGAFLPGQSLYNTLWDKYYTEHPQKYYEALVSINDVRVEANPGTVVYLQEEGESVAMRHIIGQTESIDFCANDLGIETAYFTGIHFEQATDYELERNKLPEGKFNKTEIVVDNLDKIEEPKEQWVYYLEPSNIPNPIIAKAVDSAIAPELASLITAKGLPIYFIKKDGEGKQNIAIIEERDLEELQVYLENLNYKIYLTDTISFTNEQQIKIATNLDNTEAFEFVLSNEDNKLKLAAYTVILNQYGDKQVTVALKRQIWKDVFYNASDYYIYLNGHWFVFDIESQDAVCPVPASIDYVCETVKSYYRTNGSL